MLPLAQMAEFTWEARTRAGEVRKGTMEAENEAAVQRKLAQQQLTPSKIRRKSKASFSFGGGVKVKEMVTFTRLFSTMINAGLPIVRCLDILASQQSNVFFKSCLADIKNQVETGSTFSEALRRHPSVF